MKEKDFVKVLKRAQEILHIQFSEKELDKLYGLAMDFGKKAISELTLTEAAYIINAHAMDMNGRYSKRLLNHIKDYYIKNVRLREEEVLSFRKINDYISLKGDSLIILKDYALEKISREIIELSYDGGDYFSWNSHDSILVIYQLPQIFNADYPDIVVNLSKHWDFLLEELNLEGSQIIDYFIKNLGICDERDFLVYKRNYITKAMKDFLDKLSIDRKWLLRLVEVLIDEDDEGFNSLMEEVKTIGFSRTEFIYWWSFNRPQTITGIDRVCFEKVNRVLDELKFKRRSKTLLLFLSGKRETFNRVKADFRILSQQDPLDYEIDYEVFKEYFIFNHYALRHILALKGVRFFPDDYENEELEAYLF